MGMSDINTADPASHPGRFPSGEKAADVQKQRLLKPHSQSRLLGEKLISRPWWESKHAKPSGNGKCWKTVACSGVFMRDCLGYNGRISTRAPILWLVRTSCACYHVSVVACLHACVYVCGVLSEKWQLSKNLIVQLNFRFRLDIISDWKIDLFSPSWMLQR
jgi:hypothetical protein